MAERSVEEKLYIDSSLYSPIVITNEELEDVIAVEKHQFDTYCIYCKNASTFKYRRRVSKDRHHDINFPELRGSQQAGYNGRKPKKEELDNKPVILTFECQRHREHTYEFFYKFLIKEQKAIKIGQEPSVADVAIEQIKNYKDVLSRNDQHFYTKAIGLYANGVGIGSFVYLRRIMENLVQETFERVKLDLEEKHEEFSQKRMDEKIKSLEGYLPEILVENRKVYAIVSKGIHELTEEECLEKFPPIRLGIELILDEKKYLKEKEKKRRQFSNFISDEISNRQ